MMESLTPMVEYRQVLGAVKTTKNKILNISHESDRQTLTLTHPLQ